MPKTCCTLGKASVMFLLGGIIVVGVGVGGSFYLDNYLRKQIVAQVVVDSFSSPGFYSWQNNTAPSSAAEFMKFYIWNVTNPEEVENGGIPIVNEMGPYSYRQHYIYFNVSFSDSGNEITWTQWNYFVWDPDTSFPGADPYNDVATIVNVPYQAVLGALQYESDTNDHWWETLVFDTLASGTNSTLFVQKHPNDLIFGYEDPLLKEVSQLQPGTSPVFLLQANETSMDEAAQFELPNTAHTGKDNISNILNFIAWENKTQLNCWSTQFANRIYGNSATQFWPGISVSDKPFTFSDNLFRSIHFEATSTVEVKGIQLINFKLPADGLLNATENPQNAQFNQFGHSGVENVSSCQSGAPVYISKPHFLDADDWFFQNIKGLQPNKNLHDTNVNVEPNIGTTMQAQKRLQVNVKLIKDYLYPNIAEEVYIPLVWIEQLGELTDEQANQFKGSVYLVLTLTRAALWGGVGLGSVFLLVSLSLAIRRYKLKHLHKHGEFQPLIN